MKRIVPAPILVCLLAAGPAAAARYTKEAVEVEASATRLTRAPSPKRATARQRAAPALDAQRLRATVERKIGALTDQAIRKLEQLVAVAGINDPDRPDLLFHLAEQYRQKSVQYRFKARELDETIYTSDPARKARLRRAQRSHEQASRRWQDKAVRTYLKIYARPAHRAYRRMDEVLFNLAAMLDHLGRHEQARAVFRRLIKDHPDSRYIADAFLSFAEHYFNQGQVEEALRLYRRVGRYPDSPIYGYALYKQGWCWLNLQNPRRALELFVRVINNAASWAGSRRGKVILIKEARKDAVRAYARVGTPARAWQLFSRIGGKHAPTMLEQLANIYYEQGQFAASVQILKKLISLAPRSRQLCQWQYRIVRASLPSKDKRQQAVETSRLAAVYQLASKRHRRRRRAVGECRDNAAGLLRELATTWHREAQRTEARETYALARQLYEVFLATFPAHGDAYRLSFYHAELLFKLERWEKAADAYARVVRKKPRGKYAKEAAYAAVIALKNALDIAPETSDVRRRADVEAAALKPRPLSALHRKLLAAFRTYIEQVPESKELVSIKYREARTYYEHNQFREAARLFGAIVTEHTDHELAVYSANLLLDSLNALNAVDELERWVDRILAMRQLRRAPDLIAVCGDLKSGLLARRAEAHRAAGRFRECADAYTRVANAYPDRPRWSTWVFNAAICFETAKLIGPAISLRSTLIKVKPDDPLAKRSLYLIGANYHALAWYSRAADYYERFARRFPGEEDAPRALQNAIVFRLGRAEYDRALKDARLFARSYGPRRGYASRTAAVIFSLGQIYEQRGDADAVLKHYSNYLEEWGGKGGNDRRIIANVRIAQALWKASCPIAGVDGACIKLTRVRSKVRIKRLRHGRQTKTIELRRQCGPETKGRTTVIARDRSKARRAMRHFATALRLYQRLGPGPVSGGDRQEVARRAQRMKLAVAAARFFQAESMYERFLDVAFPRDLDFSQISGRAGRRRTAAAQRRFVQYLEQKGRLLAVTREVYRDVIKLKVAHWAIAAAARIGQLYQHFADALYTAPVPRPPIPKVLRTRAQRDEFVALFTEKYCEGIEQRARPLEKKAVRGLAICLKKSTELSWYNQWSRLCERELNQIDPLHYPLASELRAVAGQVNLQPDRAGVASRLN